MHLIVIVKFPSDSHTFNNILEDKHKFLFKFKKQRGVYLFTHINSQKQYVGSSRDLGFRLSKYFRTSYLKLQSNRSSGIARAILKYGLHNFVLSVLVLGPTPNPSEKINKDSLPDYLIKEQYYLDNYKLEFNIQRRVVHTNYVPSSGVSVNVGQSNPSYNLLGKNSFA